jgi:hypothetical protein
MIGGKTQEVDEASTVIKWLETQYSDVGIRDLKGVMQQDTDGPRCAPP